MLPKRFKETTMPIPKDNIVYHGSVTGRMTQSKSHIEDLLPFESMPGVFFDEIDFTRAEQRVIMHTGCPCRSWVRDVYMSAGEENVLREAMTETPKWADDLPANVMKIAALHYMKD
jgi:hypothetical protein